MPYFISFIFMLIQAVSAVNPSYKPNVIYKPSFIENRRDYPKSKQLAKQNSYKFNQPVKSENTISKFALKLLQDWIRWILIVLPIYFAVNYPPLLKNLGIPEPQAGMARLGILITLTVSLLIKN